MHSYKRAYIDSRKIHWHDQPTDSLMFQFVRISAHEHFAVVGGHCVRGPDLLAADDVIVAVAECPGSERGQVAPGARFGKPLTPRVIAGEDPAQVMRLLRFRAFGDNCRTSVHLANEADPNIWSFCCRGFLEEDQMFSRRGAAAAMLRRPINAGVASLKQKPLPMCVKGTPSRPVFCSRGFGQRRDGSA